MAKKGVKGSKHYRYNPYRVTKDGYRLVSVGKSHPLNCGRGYALEHWLVWVSAGNPIPSRSENIHHINGDKLDNRIENLSLIDAREHARQHAKEKTRDKNGRFIPKPKVQKSLF
jgi:hypothetical protein